MAVYLGFDCSTQGFSAVAIEVQGTGRRVVWQHALGFDEALPHYRTRHGVLESADPLVARSSPLLWAEALDAMMGIVARESGLELSEIRAIAGSAQQHGTVYLNETAARTWAGLDAGRPLGQQVGGIFARAEAPIWMDASTGTQCDEITRAMGGAERLAALTGSRAFPRFAGPQIRKYARDDPLGYAATDRIHLVSSYLASLLVGRHAALEPGDGAGMNLMDLRRRSWSEEALAATAPGLAAKLPSIVSSWTILGPLAPYWVKRYGFPPAHVVAFSGDNSCSLVGTGLVREGRVAISLGTSDTLFGPMREPRIDPTGSGHVFGAPTGEFMSLVCCRNGSLARERVRDEYRLDWDGFSGALRETSPGNGGGIMLPWFEPETTPPVPIARVRRYALDPCDGPANVRAVVEAQMMALAIHSRWMGVTIEAIHATGGAARNREILQVMADVHGAPVHRLAVGNSACLGAALRAYHADRMAAGERISWEDVVVRFTAPVPGESIAPVPAHVARYAELIPVYEACERQALGSGEDPPPLTA